jgi:CYTH domain-containing protein
MSEQAGKYARVELERRFLVHHLPEAIETERGWRISDRYLANTQLRLRRMRPLNGGETLFKLGQKLVQSPPDFGRMTVTNIYLSAEEYAVLAALDALELHKRRYPFSHDGRLFGIDVFEENLSGLVLAETSFETVEAMDQPLEFPPWIATEVSRDSRFTGGALAGFDLKRAAELIRESKPHQ